MAEFKKLSEVEIVESPADNANVLIEEEGVIKKVAKSAVGSYDVIIEVEEHFEEATGSRPIPTFNVICGSYAELKAKLEAKKPITGYISVVRKQDIFDECNVFNVIHALYFGDGSDVVTIVAGTGGEYSGGGYVIHLHEDGTIE